MNKGATSCSIMKGCMSSKYCAAMMDYRGYAGSYYKKKGNKKREMEIAHNEKGISHNEIQVALKRV